MIQMPPPPDSIAAWKLHLVARAMADVTRCVECSADVPQTDHGSRLKLTCGDACRQRKSRRERRENTPRLPSRESVYMLAAPVPIYPYLWLARLSPVELPWTEDGYPDGWH